MEAENILNKLAQDEGFGNWDTLVLNCHHSVIKSVAIAAVNQALYQSQATHEQEQMDKIYAELSAYEKEIADHNEQVLKLLGREAQEDFEELLDCCNVTEKIKLVDFPKGHDNKEHCGVFRNVHVDQWCTNMEGDSYAGFIYANVRGQWIEVPFSC